LDRSLKIFALDIDGNPVLTFAAIDMAQAEEICRDPELRADLSGLTSSGTPICSANSALVVRTGDPREIAAFEHALSRAPASSEPTMAFLIKIDGVVVFVIDP
jgi:hypothetical protein